MAFILTAELDEDPQGSFEKYRHYLDGNRNRFPPGALALVDSDWYFSDDPRNPHDAWLESATITEHSSGERLEERWISITLKLLGAYHDGHIQFHYPRVFSYSFDTQNSSGGHNDWRYNEFRISEESHLIHEIEWWGPQPTARWIIESDDVEYQWLPLEDS